MLNIKVILTQIKVKLGLPFIQTQLVLSFNNKINDPPCTLSASSFLVRGQDI